MDREEYNRLFHKHKLNLVAFKPLNDCDEEVLKLVNAAIEAEREACARLCDQMFHDWCNQEFEDEDEAYRNKPDAEDCKKAIRERGNK
jgi:hypothetical protein